MDTLVPDIWNEILFYLRPQENINALLCTCKAMHTALVSCTEKNQWSFTHFEKDFFKTVLLTPFQKECLKELLIVRETYVSDVDNGELLCKILHYNFLMARKTSAIYTVGVDMLFKKTKTNPDIAICFFIEGLRYAKGEDMYIIYLCENPLPVDEYTPLLVSNIMITERSKFQVNNLDLPNPVFLVKDAGEAGPNIPRLEVNQSVTYRKLKRYNSFICSFSVDIWRISSLLMQFSRKPKKFVTYSTSYKMEKNKTPFPAKKRWEYELCFPGLLYHSNIGIFSSKLTLAEFCLVTAGYDFHNIDISEAWLHSLVDEVEALERKNNIFIEKVQLDQRLQRPIWYCLNPFADWNSIIDSVNDARFANGRPNRKLRKKLRYSLKQPRGSKGGDSFTLKELKELCKTHNVQCSGTRKQLINRLLAL